MAEHVRRPRWGPEGPPESAYGNVSNPERFAPLHDVAVGLIDRLNAEYHVVRAEAFDLDPALMRRLEPARPTVRLTPRGHAAPLTVGFTSLPGLIVRFGHWAIEPFPVCSCDACDATAEQETERFLWLADNVVSGRFRESIRLPLIRSAWLEWKSWRGAEVRSSKSRLERARARQLVEGLGRDYSWETWARV